MKKRIHDTILSEFLGGITLRIECEITNVRTSKKGDTITIFVGKEHRKNVVDHIMPFIERPVTMELMVDAKNVLESMDRITEEQRAKTYKTIHLFAKEYGDTEENTKNMLKERFGRDFSLSDCTKDVASDFINFIEQLAIENGYSFASQSNALERSYKIKKCFVCSDDGSQYSNEVGKICLCETHVIELRKVGTGDFMTKYHLKLI